MDAAGQPPVGVIKSVLMSDTETPQDTSEVVADTATSDAPKTSAKRGSTADLAPPAVEMSTVDPQPVDDGPVEPEPPELRPGAMGPDRAKLVMALGFDGTHAFDAEVEDMLRARTSYDGVVDKTVWEELAVLLV
jgi:hypothetical protein